MPKFLAYPKTIRFTLLLIISILALGFAQKSDSEVLSKGKRYHDQFKAFLYIENDKAKSNLDSLKQVALTSQIPKLKYYFHYDAGLYYFETYNLERSLDHFNKALAVAKKIGLEQEKIEAKIWTANHHYFSGDSITTIQLFKEILKESENINFIDGIANAYSGFTLFETDKSKVLQWLIKIDSIYTSSNEKSALLANAYSTIGKIYQDTYNNLGLAKEYYAKSLEISEEVNYAPGITYISDMLGNIAFEEGNLEEAHSYFARAYQKSVENKDTIDQARILAVMAQIETEQNKLTDAKKKLNRALSIFKTKKDSILQAFSYLQLANIAIKEGDFTSSNKHLHDAKKLPENLASHKHQKELLETEITYAEKTKDFETAFRKQKILDSLTSAKIDEENQTTFLNLEKQFDRSKKEKEIALLKSQKALEQQQKVNERMLFLGVLALSSIAGLFFFFQYRNRKRTNTKLKELDRAKSTFFANISHEFRTPITLIKGPIEDQLNQQNLQVSQRRNLLAAQRNTDRLENLVEQLLALSKLESGTTKLQVQPGDLNSFIVAQIEAFQYRATEQNIAFMVDLSEENREAWFDRDIVEKISFNFIGNAFKYTPEGGSIAVKGGFSKDHYQLQVKNSGMPFSASEKKKIFNRFYQNNPQNTGMGIGLALTKELVELHKGLIEVTEEGNQFIIFNIKFPISKNAFTDKEILSEQFQTEISETKEVTEEQAFPSIDIAIPEDAPILLVVDDSKDILNYVSSIFETEYQVLQATDGSEAFKLAKKHIPDLIISDVMMPEEDGFSLTKNLKEHTLTSHIPIILLTAKNRIVDQLEGMGVGADAYMTKPFSSQLVKANVKNLIENRRKLQERFSQEVILKPVEIAVISADQQFLEKLRSVIEDNLTDPEFSASQFSEAMGVSRMQLHRKLKALSGQSTSEFLRSQRLRTATKLLKDKELTISEIGYSVGFNDPSYFTKCFKQDYGVSPTEYAKQSR